MVSFVHSYLAESVNSSLAVTIAGSPTGQIFHGDGLDRKFNVDSTAVRTSQIIVVDTDIGKVTAANFVGTTIEYDGNGNEINRQTANNDGMRVNSSVLDNGAIIINADISIANPLIQKWGIHFNGPKIDYSMQFVIDKGNVFVTGSHNQFPTYEVYGNVNGNGYQPPLYTYMPSGDAKGLFDFTGEIRLVQNR